MKPAQTHPKLIFEHRFQLFLSFRKKLMHCKSIGFLSGQEKKFFSNFRLGCAEKVSAFLGPNGGNLDFGTKKFSFKISFTSHHGKGSSSTGSVSGIFLK